MEFKESFDKSISKEIIAFANSSGGRIFLGISDDGKIKGANPVRELHLSTSLDKKYLVGRARFSNGVNPTNKLKSQIQDIAKNCDPAIKIKLKEFKNILIIEIKEGADKPYKCSSGFYLRQGANSQKMS